MPKKLTVGVFDSGVGGKSVAKAISDNFPGLDVIFERDAQNLPYGNKSPDELLKIVLPILNTLSKSCDVIVVACNTVTTNIIQDLREFITVPIIGLEPMIKPASLLTKSKVIAVCATPSTLKSKRYQELKDLYAKGITIIEPDCSQWAAMIENNQISHAKIAKTVEFIKKSNADVIVLGCTHYHWIEKDIRTLGSENIAILQPEDAIVNRLKQVLGQLD